MRVKSLGPVLWRTAGLGHVLQIVVIAPLSYRLRKNSKQLYRRPAFLVCTDPAMDLCSIVQGYVQRCDIETNFRDEKTLLGVGQAEVRNAHSVEAVPAFQVASYAMLLIATQRGTGTPRRPCCPARNGTAARPISVSRPSTRSITCAPKPGPPRSVPPTASSSSRPNTIGASRAD